MLRFRPTLRKVNCVSCEIAIFRNRNSQFRKFAIFRNPFYNPGLIAYSSQTVEKLENRLIAKVEACKKLSFIQT